MAGLLSLKETIQSCIKNDETVNLSIQYWLKKVGPLKKYSESDDIISFDAVLKVFNKALSKFAKSGYLFTSPQKQDSGEVCYSFTIGFYDEKHDTVYGVSLYEVFAKAILLIVEHKKRGQ